MFDSDMQAALMTAMDGNEASDMWFRLEHL
jgi:hypothetical protein